MGMGTLLFTYVATVLGGIISGIYITLGIDNYKDEKGVFRKAALRNIDKKMDRILLYSAISIFIYIGFFYTEGVGIKNLTYVEGLKLLEKMILTPLLIITFMVDYRHRIIANRVTMLLFQLGVFFLMLHTIDLGSTVNNTVYLKEGVMGLLLATTIFGLMIVLGGIIAGKEAMGMGDIKFMAPIGMFVGFMSILDITLAAFMISGVLAILILLYRKIRKISDDYIPFGPFLVLSIFLMLFLKPGTVTGWFMEFTTTISNYLLLIIR